MGGQHLAVGVDVDALVLGLLQKLFEVIEIVTRDHDKRPFLHLERHTDRDRIAKGFGIRLVQQLHAGIVDLSDFQHDGQQVVHVPILAEGKERLGQELVDLVARVAEDARMVSVCRHAPDAKEDQRLKGADIFVRVPDFCHVIIIVSAARRAALRAAGDELFLLRMYLVDQRV